jgi:diguanylate cyclase (GGDEF)-like protein
VPISDDGMSLVLIQFGLSLLAALLGGAAGWWLRGRPAMRAARPAPADRKQTAAHVLQSLQSAADTVRACVEQHTECIRTIQSELNETTSTEPAIITKAAESIAASNGLVQHQFNDIRSALDDKRREIRDCLANTEGLLFTFAALDRQKHMYRQVLSSLEVLAAELAGDIKGHGQRLQKISGDLDNVETTDGIASAVTQILDATDDVQTRLAIQEQRIAAQAATVHMQAILTHADLLTSLPNRRALDAELERAAAAPTNGRAPLCTVVFVDLDGFSQVNTEYGHEGGDLVLRQAAGMIKQQVRGRDMVARFGGDTFAMLLNQTTLHDALPIAERVRTLLEETEFSHGTRPLRVTVSVGIAQLTPEEMRGAVLTRVEETLQAAQGAGGNVCYRHDGQQCHPVSSVFHMKQQPAAEQALSLASLWRDSGEPVGSAGGGESADEQVPLGSRDLLSGRSLFAANLGRRLAEWKRGGPSVSVAVLRIDQMAELVEQFGEQGQAFLRQVLGRLLEAATRDMDERCEFEDGLFALLLPGTDEANARVVAERLRSQIRQCKVRMDNDLWDLTASIGLAHCTVAARVMDIMLSAEAAMHAAVQLGGDAVCVGQSVQDPLAAGTQ